MRRTPLLITVTIGLAVSLWLGLRAEPAQAGLVQASVTPFPTSAAIVADTDAGGVVYWCIVGYPIRKFYGTTSPTADCGAPSSDPERGWVLGGPVTSLQVKFSVPHLAPETNYTLTLSAWNIVPASEQNQLSVGFVTLSKLRLAGGPTVTPPSPHTAGSTVPVTWQTDRAGDSLLRYSPAAPQWRQDATGSTFFRNAWGVDNSLAFVVGDAGAAIVWRPDGNGWRSVGPLGSQDLRGAVAFDQYVLWAVGGNGTVFFSDDRGESWTRLTEGLTRTLFDAVAPSTDRLTAVGQQGRVLSTTDRGTTWATQTLSTGQLQAIGAADPSTFWIVGEAGTIFKTTNGGTTWVDQSQVAASTLIDVAAVTPSMAFAASLNGEIWQTLDGATWSRAFTVPFSLNTVVAASNGEAWAFGLNANAAYRDPATGTWSLNTLPAFGNNLYGAWLGSRNHLIAVGQNGNIIQYEPPYSVSLGDANQVSAHSLAVSALVCQSTYWYRVLSASTTTTGDSVASSPDQTFTTGACPDSTPPTVSFRPTSQWTPPVSGPYVTSAGLTVFGDAADNAGGSGLRDVTLTHVRGTPPVTTTVATDPPLVSGSLTYAWSKAVTLQPGLNAFRAHAVDNGFNANTPPDPEASVTYDASDPVVTIDPPNNVSRSVAVASLSISGTTSDPTPASGLASLTLRQNGALAYTQPFAGNPASGTWSTTLTLTSGPNVIEVSATDVAGRTGAPASVTITLDTGGPVISDLVPFDDACENGPLPILLIGQVTDGSGVASLTITHLESGAAVAASLVSGGFTANLNAPPLRPGVNTFSLTATDTLGNATTVSHRLRYDPNPPTITLNQPSDGSVTVVSQGVHGSADDPNTPPATYSCGLLGVEVRNGPTAGSGTYVPATLSSNPWTTINLASGDNYIQGRLTDRAGNQTESNIVHVILDTSNPTDVEITEVQGQSVPPTPPGPVNVGTATVSVRGTAQDNATIQTIALTRQPGAVAGSISAPALPVSGSPATASWTGTILLEEGLNRVSVAVTDNARHTTTDTVDVVYTAPDTTRPVITPGSATSGTICSPPGTNVVFLEASWTTDEASDTAAVWHDLDAGTFGTILTDPVPPGTLVHLVRVQPAVPNHQYEIYVSSRDAADNAAAAHTFTVRAADSCDITDPNVTFLQPRDRATVSDVVTIEVEATDNRGVKEIEFFIDDISQGVVSCVGLATCRRSISWDTSAIVGPTNYLLRAVATDTSDRTGSGQITVTVDNTRPVITNVSNTNAVESGGVWTVTVTWETNVGATSLVRYGRETSSGTYSYGPEVSDGAFMTSHSITLTNLAGNSIYHYQVESCDTSHRCSQG